MTPYRSERQKINAVRLPAHERERPPTAAAVEKINAARLSARDYTLYLMGAIVMLSWHGRRREDNNWSSPLPIGSRLAMTRRTNHYSPCLAAGSWSGSDLSVLTIIGGVRNIPTAADDVTRRLHLLPRAPVPSPASSIIGRGWRRRRWMLSHPPQSTPSRPPDGGGEVRLYPSHGWHSASSLADPIGEVRMFCI